MEVPPMCSESAVVRSLVTFFPPLRCLAPSFRAPGEITVPAAWRVVIILPVFPAWPFLIPVKIIVPDSDFEVLL